MSEDKLEVDDYMRWLGKQKPAAFAWYGLAALELAAAIFIGTEAYIRYGEYVSQHEMTNAKILEAIAEQYRKE